MATGSKRRKCVRGPQFQLQKIERISAGPLDGRTTAQEGGGGEHKSGSSKSSHL